MSAHKLAQTLLIDPKTSFSSIEKRLEKLGWTRGEDHGLTPPLIQGEPELATWSWQGDRPFIIYTFNPLVNIRVLDVATLPPAMRATIASQWPLLDELNVKQLFTSKDIKARLLGLWAAKETARVDLVQYAEQMMFDPEPFLAEQARDIVSRLRYMDQAHRKLLADLKFIAQDAVRVIRNLGNQSFVRELKPQENELSDLFDENLKPFLSPAVDFIYSHKLHLSDLIPGDAIKVFAAPAGLLRRPNKLSDKFPRGYRDLAGWMNPKRVWLCWHIMTQDRGRASYDGLVRLAGRWVWLPKIYRYLTPGKKGKASRR